MKIILALLIGASCCTAATTTNIYTVKPGGGGDYLSLSAWEAGRAAAHLGSTYNLLTDDTVEIAECYGGGVDTNKVTFHNWVTDTNRHLIIRTPLSERHSGVWDQSKYYMLVSDESIALHATVNYTKIIGLQIGITNQSKTIEICYIAGSFCELSHCIIRGNNSSANATRGISVIEGMKIWNTLIYDIGNNASGVCIQNHKASEVYSSTFIGGTGIQTINFNDGGYTCTIKNCYVGGAVGFHTITGGGSTVNITTCATSDSDGSTGLQNKGISATNFVSVTAGSLDYHIIGTSILKGAGTDTSGDSYPLNFTTDIDGQTRAAPWDVGADQYQAASTAQAPPLLLRRRVR